MLSLHRRLIGLRRAMPALSVGSYTHVYTDDDLLVYERSTDTQRALVALNLSHAPRTLTWSEPGSRIILSTHMDREEDTGERLELRPDEGVVIATR